ncbi:MAG: methyltransferase domain-containing protein [Nitrospina sp.]|nr:methyltransferase domain-containing protein [Nitrospina sp.]
MTNRHDPHQQIYQQNPWYTDDQFAKQYERPGTRAIIEGRWRVFEKAINDFFKTNNKPYKDNPSRILDAGCGDGINLLGLNNMIRAQNWNALLYGTDYNPLRLERASMFSFVEEIKQSPLDNLPYEDNWFDVVLCNQVLEHIPEDKKVLLEFKRVIRPGGLLILGVPNEGCALAWFRNHMIQRSILKLTDHVNFYTQKSVSRILTDSDFEILKIEKAGIFLPHLTLNYLISITKPGRKLLNILGMLFQSQSAELILISINN